MKRWKPGYVAAALLAVGTSWGAAAEMPVRGGTLTYVVGSEIPSLDMHRETTFGTVHPVRPFYSLLIRLNPDNLQSTTDFVCDLCVGSVPEPTDGGTTYAFAIRKDARWQGEFYLPNGKTLDQASDAEVTAALGDLLTRADIKAVLGTRVTAHDVAASINKMIDPPERGPSARRAFFSMVEGATAPDDDTLIVKLKFPSTAFLPALAMPYNSIYPKAITDKDPGFFAGNVLGSGPFIFTEYQTGAFVTGKRNPDWYGMGEDGKPLPYLDGFRSIIAEKEAVRIQAIRGDRAGIEFRGFAPKSRDELVQALGDKITVQESDWNCLLTITPNHKAPYLDNPDARRALTLAIDRWGGSKYLSQIAVVRTVGGIVYPHHPLAATKEELEQMAGYWPDLKKSREAARDLLRKAGVPEGHKIVLANRAVDQPYRIVGTWLVDQWKAIGLDAEQLVEPSATFYDNLRTKKRFDVALDFNCQSVANPPSDTAKYISEDATSIQYGQFIDRKSDELYEAMLRETDPVEQRTKMRAYEKYTVDEGAHNFVSLWWYRIVPHRSYVKGWTISPSHYINQALEAVWCVGGKCADTP